jgi:CAAD domains of cyanobacterial aminoacyl-tRNA synthetase
MSIDLTTEISRIDDRDPNHVETPKAEEDKPAEAKEYDNAHVENAFVENMDPMPAAMVDDEDRTESANAESIATMDDRAEMAMANDENALADANGESAVAADLSDAAMGYGEDPIADASSESATIPDLGEDAIAVNGDFPAESPSEAIATTTLDDTIAATDSNLKVANESPVTHDLADDAMKYDQKSLEKSAGEIEASLHSSSEAVVDNEYAPIPASMGTEATTATADVTDEKSIADSAKEIWQSLQSNNAELLNNAKSSVTEYYQHNRQLFDWLGLTVVAFVGIKLLFAGLNAVDSIPLMSPILKIVGLYYTVRFVSRYLIREQDRKELMQAIDRTKTEIFGS